MFDLDTLEAVLCNEAQQHPGFLCFKNTILWLKKKGNTEILHCSSLVALDSQTSNDYHRNNQFNSLFYLLNLRYIIYVLKIFSCNVS